MEQSPSLHEYFNRLEAVQQKVAELLAARDLVHHHVSNGAQVLGSGFFTSGLPPEIIGNLMVETQRIAKDARNAATQRMSAVFDVVGQHNLLNINMPMLEIQPELVNKQSYDTLDGVLTMLVEEGPSIKTDLAKLRRDAEMALVEKARLAKTGQLRKTFAS